MSNRPDSFMPFYVGDYLRDTLALTRDQHGAYCLLLMAYWGNGGPLPNDDDALAAITKATPQEWKKLRPVMLRYFEEDDGLWHQKRADREIVSAQKRYDRAVKGAEAKHNPSKRQARHKHVLTDSLGEVQADDKQVLNRCKPQPQPQENGPTDHSRSGLGAARDLTAAPPNHSEPGWEVGHERWEAFKAKLGQKNWDFWFKDCRLNGADTSLIAPTTFRRDELGKRYYTPLEDHFGAPVTIKVADGAAYAPE